jgi:hypothetical protein
LIPEILKRYTNCIGKCEYTNCTEENVAFSLMMQELEISGGDLSMLAKIR